MLEGSIPEHASPMARKPIEDLGGSGEAES